MLVIPMGCFPKFYTALFEENPSETLNRSLEHHRAFIRAYVEREEELD
jgi:hypothetical protein